MKDGGMEQVVENCWTNRKMSSGKYHHLLPLRVEFSPNSCGNAAFYRWYSFKAVHMLMES